MTRRVRIEYPPGDLCHVYCRCGWDSGPIFPQAALEVADTHQCESR